MKTNNDENTNFAEEEHKIDYTHLENENLDDSEILIYELHKIILNLYKSSIEELGYDLGIQFTNDIDYINYLEENNITFLDDFYNLDPKNINAGMPYNFNLDPGELTDIGISEGMLNFISIMETSHRFGYKMSNKDLFGFYNTKDSDGGRFKTYGYGLRDNPVTNKPMQLTKESWSQQELENLYKYTIKLKIDKLNKWASNNNVNLNQNQKDAIVSAMFNFGDGFLTNKGKVYSNTVNMIKQNPNDQNIKESWSHMSDAQARKKNSRGLMSRRMSEANWYFGIYS